MLPFISVHFLRNWLDLFLFNHGLFSLFSLNFLLLLALGYRGSVILAGCSVLSSIMVAGPWRVSYVLPIAPGHDFVVGFKTNLLLR